MYDAKKIIFGLVIFLGLITAPAWYSVASGKATYVPELEIVTDAEQCILPAKEMRTKHKDLLNDWKKSVVRQGDRIYVASGGQEYNMSLTGTCLNCHSNKADFCVQCHDYVAVKPTCWNCHNEPEGD